MPEQEYEFHNRVYGWVAAERVPRGHPEVGLEQRDGTVHLRATLPNGHVITRRNVAHESHRAVPNILAGGRCRLCGLPTAENDPSQHAEPEKHGRVYRIKRQAPQPERETEPAQTLPEPQTLEQVKAQAPRRLATAER